MSFLKEQILSDSFAYSSKVTKSHILAIDTPIRIEDPEGQKLNPIAAELKSRQKRGRLLGSERKILVRKDD